MLNEIFRKLKASDPSTTWTEMLDVVNQNLKKEKLMCKNCDPDPVLSGKAAIQDSKEYKEMSMYHAIEIAEGFGDGENPTPEEQKAAWQWLYDQKAYLHLQGFYGRTMRDMINDGFIYA